MAYRKKKKRRQVISCAHCTMATVACLQLHSAHPLVGGPEFKEQSPGHAISWQRESTRELEETQNLFKLLLA